MVPVCRKIAPREAYFRQGSDPLPRKKVQIRIWQKETHPEIRHTALGKDCGVRWADFGIGTRGCVRIVQNNSHTFSFLSFKTFNFFFHMI